jgi:hypothetical protein
LDEAVTAIKNPPSTFQEFRRRVASALKRAKAPAELVDEISDVSNEGGGTFTPLWKAWDEISHDMQGAKDLKKEWEDAARYYVYDAVIDMLDAYGDPMNYAPGHRAKRVDAQTLAQAVVDTLVGETRSIKMPTNHVWAKNVDTAMNAVAALEATGAVANVDWDKKDVITFIPTRHDYQELFDAEAVDSGFFVPVNDDLGSGFSSGWRDPVTGLVVSFASDGRSMTID